MAPKKPNSSAPSDVPKTRFGRTAQSFADITYSQNLKTMPSHKAARRFGKAMKWLMLILSNSLPTEKSLLLA